MKFSMDGFRKTLSKDVRSLRDIIKDVVEGNDYDEDDLIEAVNEVIQHSNVLNCVSIEGDESFTDISNISVEYIDLENEGSEA